MTGVHTTLPPPSSHSTSSEYKILFCALCVGFVSPKLAVNGVKSRKSLLRSASPNLGQMWSKAVKVGQTDPWKTVTQNNARQVLFWPERWVPVVVCRTPILKTYVMGSFFDRICLTTKCWKRMWTVWASFSIVPAELLMLLLGFSCWCSLSPGLRNTYHVTVKLVFLHRKCYGTRTVYG